MIDFDNLRGKADEFLEDHAEQIDKGIDKAAGMAGKKYGHGSQIEQGADKLKDLLPGGDEDEAPQHRGAGGPRRGAGQHRQQGGQHGPRQGGGQHRGRRPQPGA